MMRGQYYFKGFGMILNDLLANCEIFAVYEATPERAGHIRCRLKTMDDLYKTIPFDQITDHPDYEIFVAIRNAIDLLYPAVEKIINGQTNIDEAEALITVIDKHGKAYRARLKAILKELREHPGHEHDGLQSTCVITGRVWNSAI